MNGQPPTKATGDEFFFAVDERDPRTLPEGVLHRGRNLRFVEGRAEPRKGVVKPAWANRTTVGSDVVSPYGTIYGASSFKDPNGLERGLLAADGYAWRFRPYNQSQTIPLPTGVKLLSRVTFCQAFDKVFCFRGRFLAPLKLTSFNDGFEDIVPHWDAAETYAADEEVAFGPYQSVTSITRSGNTATVITPVAHGYITGADITHTGAGQSEYNIRANITVVDEFTYTFAVSGSPASPATGTIKASNQLYYWRALGSLHTLASLTRVGTTATATKVAHGWTTGQSVTIAGATPAGYNGTYTITVTSADTFTYVMAADPGSSATGTLTARNGIVLAAQSPDSTAEAWTRVYNVLPNADNARYANNLMLVPTAYQPASVDNYATFTGGEYSKKDFLVAMDYQDETHFQFFNEFRINQGSDDEIVDLAKFNENTWIVWKERSWGVLSNVGGDFSSLTLDFREGEYGLAAVGAWAVSGRQLYFYSKGRGIVSIEQSEQGKLAGVDVPLSAPIARTLSRINGPLASLVRMAVWDNKLYCAVPLDDGTCLTRPPEAPELTQAGTADGQTLYWTAPATATSYNIYGVYYPGGEHILLSSSAGNSLAPALPGQAYVVTAVNERGESAYSNEVTTP